MFGKNLFVIIMMLSSLLCSNESQETPNNDPKQIFVIQLNNGDTISGKILESDENVVIIRSAYGDIEISRDTIISINAMEAFKKSVSVTSKLNQEARWRTIYLGMSTSNTLYGLGIPYVLNINEGQFTNGFRLMMFGGSFYAMYNYTSKMEIPYGRSQFQYTGASFGGLSLFPIMATVGWENWQNIDEDGKVSWIYEMMAIPYGVVLADKLYYKWGLTNGQASMVSSSSGLGLVNSALLLDLIYDEGWYDTDISRLFVPLTYLGGLGHGLLMKNYVDGKAYTEDDAFFVKGSSFVGWYNWINFMMFTEIDNILLSKTLFLAGINGFQYMANSINEEYDLDRGQSRIIALGTGASILFWNGVFVLIGGDVDSKLYFAGNMVSITAGWYFTHRMVVTSGNNDYSSDGVFNKFISRVSISPTFQINNNKIIPLLNFKINY